MAIGWLTLLQNVPWADVVSNAPKVAAGAKKLWSAVGRNPLAPESSSPEMQAALSPQAQALAVLESRTAELQAATAELQKQMIASSGLIKELAEQNTQLILRIETLRIRLAWLAGAAAVGILTGVAAVAMAFILAP